MTTASSAFDLVRAALEQSGVRYAVGGSWASTAFGDPRLTNDVDILAEFTEENLPAFLSFLPETFYADAPDALQALRRGRPFNVIHIPTVLKFDFFPSRAFPLGAEELERAISISVTSLSQHPVWFVTPEDILLAKLHWFRLGGEMSEVQWRDIQGVVHGCAENFDYGYLERSAKKLGILDLQNRVRPIA